MLAKKNSVSRRPACTPLYTHCYKRFTALRLPPLARQHRSGGTKGQQGKKYRVRITVGRLEHSHNGLRHVCLCVGAMTGAHRCCHPLSLNTPHDVQRPCRLKLDLTLEPLALAITITCILILYLYIYWIYGIQ